MKKPLLSAIWKNLVMANYAIDPKLLQHYLPLHTEPDLFNGVCYVSLVGFLFDEVRVKGLSIPFHTRFPEVNLRFYVRRNTAHDESRRGVVFISEIVPKLAIAWVANTFFREKYLATKMNYSFIAAQDELSVEYSWHNRQKANSIKANVLNRPQPVQAGSEEEFILEHYFGYAKAGHSITNEYAVEHPRWNVFPVKSFAIDCNFEQQYGAGFSALNQAIPVSVFVAEGSGVVVGDKKVISQ